MIRVILGLAAVATLFPTRNDLVGTWTVSYPWHVEIVNGVATPTMETSRATFEIVGDSIIATLLRSDESLPAARRTMRLAALAARSPTVFQDRNQVTASTPTGDRVMVVVNTWTFEARGERLTGTLERRLEGQSGAGPMPLHGERSPR